MGRASRRREVRRLQQRGYKVSKDILTKREGVRGRPRRRQEGRVGQVSPGHNGFGEPKNMLQT